MTNQELLKRIREWVEKKYQIDKQRALKPGRYQGYWTGKAFRDERLLEYLTSLEKEIEQKDDK